MLDLDGREHLGVKGLYVSSLHPCCLWNALDLWNLQFVFPVFTLVSPGIFCDSSDGEMMVCLIGSNLLLNPALP